MTEWPRYPKAPIVEALLDIRVSFLSLIEPARLASFQDAIRDRYPTKASRNNQQPDVGGGAFEKCFASPRRPYDIIDM